MGRRAIDHAGYVQWFGKESEPFPLDKGQKLDIKVRSGATMVGYYDNFRWTWINEPDDIVGYKPY
jgi:hypothetical protein